MPDPSVSAAQVAYALPRQLGSAVTRNKIRRCLREIVRNLDREAPTGLSAGLYLIGTQRASRQFTHADLRVSLLGCLAKLDRAVS